MADSAATKKRRSGSIIKVAIGAAVVVLVFVFVRVFDVQDLFKSLLSWIEQTGFWGPVIFIGLYILATVLFIPGSILTLGAGFVFGVVMGTVYVSIGSIIGATFAFLLGRYLARDWVRGKVETSPRFKAIDDAVGREGWKIVGLTRLSPIFPYNLLNYAYGLTKVSLRGYFLASWVGMLPGTVMYVYIGSLAADLATLGTGARARTPVEWALYGVGLAATVVVTVLVTRLARKALRQRVDAGAAEATDGEVAATAGSADTPAGPAGATGRSAGRDEGSPEGR